jgi:delta-aminolevulinic acid dehydratase/porphobilinogen synthase
MRLVARPRLEIASVISFHLRPGDWQSALLYVALSIFASSPETHIVFQQRDVAEGADIIMVKPALPYLDILADAEQLAPAHPLACYQVSGEYAMVVAGARAGVYELRTMAFETVESMIRAGATLILTYFTPEFLEWLDV